MKKPKLSAYRKLVLGSALRNAADYGRVPDYVLNEVSRAADLIEERSKLSMLGYVVKEGRNEQ